TMPIRGRSRCIHWPALAAANKRIGGKHPSRYRVTRPSDADVVKPVIWCATAFAISYEDGMKPSVLNHWAEGLGRRALVVFDKNNYAARFEEITDGTQEISM